MIGAGGAYLHRSLNEPCAPRLQQILSDRAAIAGAIEELNVDANRLPSIFKVARSLDSKSAIRSGSCISTDPADRTCRTQEGLASRFLSNCRSRPMKGVMSRLRTNPR